MLGSRVRIFTKLKNKVKLLNSAKHLDSLLLDFDTTTLEHGVLLFAKKEITHA